jgi:hypothetical protein
VRSAIPFFLAILAFATTPARAQGTWLDAAVIHGPDLELAPIDRLKNNLVIASEYFLEFNQVMEHAFRQRRHRVL